MTVGSPTPPPSGSCDTQRCRLSKNRHIVYVKWTHNCFYISDFCLHGSPTVSFKHLLVMGVCMNSIPYTVCVGACVLCKLTKVQQCDGKSQSFPSFQLILQLKFGWPLRQKTVLHWSTVETLKLNSFIYRRSDARYLWSVK